MALPGGRTLELYGRQYSWMLRSGYGKDRYGLGWTPAIMVLTIQVDGVTTQYLCESRHWTAEHEQAWQEGTMWRTTDHKVPFGPRQVRQVIETGGSCALVDWLVSRKA